MGGAEGRDTVDRMKRKDKMSKRMHHTLIQPTVVSTVLEDVPKSPTLGLPAWRRYHGLPHGTPLPKGTWTVPISTVTKSTGGAVIKHPCCVLPSHLRLVRQMLLWGHFHKGRPKAQGRPRLHTAEAQTGPWTLSYPGVCLLQSSMWGRGMRLLQL